MYGVVSLLPQPFYDRVEGLWKELEEEGLHGVWVTPYPHFSWQVAETYAEEDLAQTLRELARQTAPFDVHTAGLGLFGGEQPVLYIAVVKSPELMAFHQRLWTALAPLSQGLIPYYAPPNWMPHITLACTDLGRQNIGAVMRRLLGRDYHWQFTVDQMVCVYEPQGTVGVLRFPTKFSG